MILGYQVTAASYLDGEPLLAQLIQELLPLDLFLTAHFMDVTHKDKIPFLFILPLENTRELMVLTSRELSLSFSFSKA